MKQRTLGYLAIVCLLAAALLAISDALARQGSLFNQLDLLVDIRSELVEGYVDEPDTQTMIEAAVHGMIQSLGDPYTTYLPPDDLEQFDRMTSGEFSGIGAEVNIENKQLLIVTPLEDSPAWHAGVLAGDIVLEIDGTVLRELFADLNTREKMINAAIERLLGDPGTQVRIKVRHTSGEDEDIVITRNVIHVQTVRGFRRQADQHFDFILDDVNGVGYVRLTQFSQSTIADLAAALDEMNAKDVKALIIDVRYNPGGLLHAAVKISDMFLKKEQVIVSVRGRSVPPQIYRATDATKFGDRPIVIIANGASASASEILAGALADNERALFVGARTFGKGSVQQVKLLGDQDTPMGALKFTTAYYYGPSNRRIHKRNKDKEGEDSSIWGVDPSPGNYVPMTPKQRREMVEVRRDSDMLKATNGHAELAVVTPQWIETELKDPQLAAALQAVLGKLDTGDWPKVGEDDTASLVQAEELAILRLNIELHQKAIVEIDKRIAKLKNKDSDDEVVEETADEPVDETANDTVEETADDAVETLPAP